MPYESTGTNHNNLRHQAEDYELYTTMYGKIERHNDVDVYKVFLRPGTIHYEFSVPTNMNYRFKVYREGNYNDDTFICRDENPCQQTRSGEETINIGEADYYYIVISFHNENDVFDTENYYSFTIYYTSLELPLNISQPYFSQLRSKCAGVCAMDISNYYRNTSYPYTGSDLVKAVQTEINNMMNGSYFDNPVPMFTGNTMYWDRVYGVTFNNTYKDTSTDPSVIYSKAVESIKAGKLMMIHYFDTEVYDINNSESHWVIPIAYGDNLDSLTVIDPYTDKTNCVNTPWSFARSKQFNMRTVTTFYYGYATSSANL